MAEALYRKYRPQVFGDVVGQDHIERTIKNAVDANQVSHAYLFCGPRGTGKTTMARLLAKALLCEHGPTSEPDGTCQECTEIAEGAHPDVYELDAASRTGVENVRDEIIGRVHYAPVRGTYKVYIIDEVHMLSTAAFNALLKTLEEPPGHVVFILCTTDPQKVPETIQSRCQRFDFHRLSNDEIVARLGAICVAEGVEFEGDALDLVAHRAEGGMRNALTSLEQLIAFGEGKVTVQGAEDLLGSLGATDMAEIIHAVGTRDAAACFNWTAGYVESGSDLAQFARDMAEHVRNLYVMSLVGSDAALDIPEAERRQLTEELAMFGPDRLARLLDVLGDVISDMRTATNPRLAFEIALTRMIRPDSDLTLEALAERIEALEAGNSAVVHSAPGAVTQPAPAPTAATTAPAPTPTAPAPTPTAPAPTTTAPAPAPTAATTAPAPVPTAATTAPAPAPTAATTAPAPTVSGDLAALVGNPAALQRVWMSVTTAVKKEKQAFAAMLVGVRARAAENGQAVFVEFPATNPISLSMARKPENFELLKRAFQAAAGFEVPFELGSASVGSSALPNNEQTSASPAALPNNEQTSASPAALPNNEQTSASPAVSPNHEQTSASPAVSHTYDIENEEQVPVDVYDSVPFEPDSAPTEEAARTPKPDPAPSSEQAAAAQLSPAPTPANAPEPTTAPGQDSDPELMDAEDLSKMFSDTMGGSIVFEEVDE